MASASASAGGTPAEIEQIKKELAKLKADSVAHKNEETRRLYREFRKKHYERIPIEDEKLDDPTEKPPVIGPAPVGDDPGRPQPEKGASTDPSTWKVVVMKDDPNLFKVIDNKGINVADRFNTQMGAQLFIDNYRTRPTEPKPGEPTPPTEPIGTPGSYPYPATSEPMQSTQRGPTTRNYASGKPSDETIEKNVKNITFKNYQFVCYVTMHEIEHPDTLSVKYGGTHMGSGWFDSGISFGDGKGQCCLGKEEEHPSTDLCVVKGPQLGEIVGKKVGIAATYYTDQNFTELWIDLGDGWKKQLEGKDVGGFNPGSDIDECQLRIDGFKEGSVPTIHSAVVTEIAPRA